MVANDRMRATQGVLKNARTIMQCLDGVQSMSFGKLNCFYQQNEYGGMRVQETV